MLCTISKIIIHIRFLNEFCIQIPLFSQIQNLWLIREVNNTHIIHVVSIIMSIIIILYFKYLNIFTQSFIIEYTRTYGVCEILQYNFITMYCGVTQTDKNAICTHVIRANDESNDHRKSVSKLKDNCHTSHSNPHGDWTHNTTKLTRIELHIIQFDLATGIRELSSSENRGPRMAYEKYFFDGLSTAFCVRLFISYVVAFQRFCN